MGRAGALVLSMGLLAAACTSSAGDGPSGGRMPEDLLSPAPGAIPTSRAGLSAGDRLLVVDGGGRVLTMRPDGEEAVALTEVAGSDLRFFQPTWSPDARRVAWTEVDTRGTTPEARLVTAGFDGVGRTAATTPVAGFYLAWDPTSSRVAYLGSAGPNENIELGVVDVEGGGESLPLDSGEPFYFSWGPEGDRLLVHVGADRLEELRLDGSAEPIGGRPGSFQAPVWSRGGTLVYAAVAGPGQALVAAEGPAGDARRLVRFDADGIAFVLSPDGGRVAFQVVGGGSPTQDRVLSVVDVAGGDVVPISPVPSLAFFWSPQGDRLMFLRPSLQQDVVWFRWIVWDGEDFFQTPRFQPSEEFARNYLPFFSQYAQSMSLWSPDGSSFAYAGTNEDGESGIWVVEAVPDAVPALVSDGVFVAWSPV